MRRQTSIGLIDDHDAEQDRMQRTPRLRLGCMPSATGAGSLIRNVSPMLCEACQQREAMVFLGATIQAESSESEQAAQWEHHFCRECADEYFARTPRMNSSRDLICLSDWCRSKLCDLLEVEHPEAFDNSDTEACYRGSELMRSFLREHLAKTKIELNEDAFEMLCGDFFGSHHFYTRVDEHNKRTS